MDHQESLYANSPLSNLTNQNVNSLSQRLDRISGIWDRDRGPPNWAGEAINLAMSSPNIWTTNNHHQFHHPHHQNQAKAASTTSLGEPPQWEAASSTKNLAESWQGNDQQWRGHQQQGQANPTYQPTSVQSLNNDDIDELYNARPASARSSYSNYHGVRTNPQLPQRADAMRQSLQRQQFPQGGGPPAYQDTVI